QVVDGKDLFLGRSRAIREARGIAGIRGSPLVDVGVFFSKLSCYFVRGRSLRNWNDRNVVPVGGFSPIAEPYRNHRVNGGEHKASAESHANKSTVPTMWESKRFVG